VNGEIVHRTQKGPFRSAGGAGAAKFAGLSAAMAAARCGGRVSVAAVALPTTIAYAELIGFEPVVGLYAAILPLLVYAIFGTSRHLIVNPDAATCAMVGTTLIPLTAVHPNSLMSL
jgi:hypothetical protein